MCSLGLSSSVPTIHLNCKWSSSKVINFTWRGAIAGKASSTHPKSLSVDNDNRQYFALLEMAKSWEELLKPAGLEGCSTVKKAPPIVVGDYHPLMHFLLNVLNFQVCSFSHKYYPVYTAMQKLLHPWFFSFRFLTVSIFLCTCEKCALSSFFGNIMKHC